MDNNNHNIDQLKTELDSIKTSLIDLADQLKNNDTLTEDEKTAKEEAIKSEAETLKVQFDTTKQKIEAEIALLQEKTDDESKENIEKYEALLDSCNEIMDLYNSILSSLSTDASTTPEATPETTTTITDNEKKWFFAWIKDWFSDKWQKFKNKDSEEKTRTIWLAAIWAWAVWLLFWLFWKKTRERRRQRREERRKKRQERREQRRKEIETLSFRETRFGRFLKWAAIWTAWVWLVYALFKHLWLIWKSDKVDGKSSDEEKFNWYEEEVVNKSENKEKFENYEVFWENIDLLYWSIYDRELKAWYEDELEMKRIATEQSDWEKYYKWIVPYCLDNHFESVENILWQNSSMKEAIAGKLDWMIKYIKGKWPDFLQLFVDNYLSRLPSWISSKLTWSLSDKIDQWRIQNQNAEKEMQYFFRQSIRIQTYLFEKRDQLILKIIKESSSKYGVSEEDILWDDENFKKYVLDIEEYQKFIGSPISSAVTVLRNYNIFDSEISEEKKEEVKELDNQRNEVLWCKEWEKDILEIINEKKEKWEDLTEEENKALGKACDGIVKDVDDRILEVVEESARNIYWDLLWSDDSHLREYLDKSWLDKVFQSYKQIILQKKLELQEWKLSNEDKIALAETINNMLALKKEAVLWSQTIEKDYDENGNIIYRIPWFVVWSIKNLGKWIEKLCHKEFLPWAEYLLSAWLWTGLVITVGWVICGVTTGKWWLARVWAKITVLPAWIWYEITNGAISFIKPLRDWISKINYPFKFVWEKWPEKLMRLLKNRKISLNKASEIASRKTQSKFILSEQTETRRKDFLDIGDGDKVTHKVFDKLVTERSGTAVWGAYIQSMRDNGIYETLVKNYDFSPEIQDAINNSASIDKLKIIAKEAEHISLLRDKILSDLDLLEKQILRGGKLSELPRPYKKQLNNLSDFRKSLSKMDPKEVERISELLTKFKWKWVSWLWNAIDQLTVLSKLEHQTIDLIDPSTWKAVKTNLDDIVRNMDFVELRKCKWGIAWVGDEAIESLAETFEAIKKSKILKFSDNVDDIANSIKALVKFLAKVS